jgi:hypothetical protein
MTLSRPVRRERFGQPKVGPDQLTLQRLHQRPLPANAQRAPVAWGFVLSALSTLARPTILAADPENRGDDAQTKYGSAARSADGLYTSAFESNDTATTPSNLAGRTISQCQSNDIVCAPGVGSSSFEHLTNGSEEIGPLGAWAPEHLG